MEIILDFEGCCQNSRSPTVLLLFRRRRLPRIVAETREQLQLIISMSVTMCNRRRRRAANVL